jgi:hypothetical protein
MTTLKTVNSLMSRRRVLKGMLGGTAITVGLPLLECFLNSNGTAMAATGEPLPPVFGTWFWGCGLSPGMWEPDIVGPNYDLKDQLKPLAAHRDKISVFTGVAVPLDGKPMAPHITGAWGMMTGNAASQVASIDSVVADAIGATTRFRSIEVSCTNVPSAGFSRRSATVVNPGEISPAALYTRLFGPEFQDPNAADFKPDPRFMVRKSVLSAIQDSHQALARKLGAADRARLDDYFSSVRQIERQVDIQLQKPRPLAACTVPPQEKEMPPTFDIAAASANHKIFAHLLAHAIACDQTRVFNVAFSTGASNLKRAGEPTALHQLTHEERIDAKVGFQPAVGWFYDRIMEDFAALLTALNEVREGDGTLLDRAVIYATTEHGEARTHSLDGVPVFLAGGANGRMKKGQHIHLPGDPGSRVGLTAQRALGISVDSWGYNSMRTSKPITEVLV